MAIRCGYKTWQKNANNWIHLTMSILRGYYTCLNCIKCKKVTNVGPLTLNLDHVRTIFFPLYQLYQLYQSILFNDLSYPRFHNCAIYKQQSCLDLSKKATSEIWFMSKALNSLVRPSVINGRLFQAFLKNREKTFEVFLQ